MYMSIVIDLSVHVCMCVCHFPFFSQVMAAVDTKHKLAYTIGAWYKQKLTVINIQANFHSPCSMTREHIKTAIM